MNKEYYDYNCKRLNKLIKINLLEIKKQKKELNKIVNGINKKYEWLNTILDTYKMLIEEGVDDD